MIHILSHLPPSSLSTVALVSRKFYSLVTTPYPWRIAFCRFFPGIDRLVTTGRHGTPEDLTLARSVDEVKSERRSFARLTAVASWRSEYILRTRLLRCLARGKPAAPFDAKAGHANVRSAAADLGTRGVITYTSGLHSLVTRLHAVFGSSQSRRSPRFVVGAEDTGWARKTDLTHARIDAWGTADPQNFLQFEQRFPGERLWGLGDGSVVGTPNVMDVSQPFGIVYGEGSPGGLVYFRAADEKRGRFLPYSEGIAAPHLGIPKIPGTEDAICAVWIAKSARIVEMTNGVTGILCGSSHGVLTAYSLGLSSASRGHFLCRDMTARWIISPGVPIIGIVVDEHFSESRMREGRGWIVVLNALGEVYYSDDLPTPQSPPDLVRPDNRSTEVCAWETGRTVSWKAIEQSKRTARPDPYRESSVEGGYSPCYTTIERRFEETKEIENFLAHKPKHFRAVCEGWDMQGKVEVDFAGDGFEIQQSVTVLKGGHGTQEPVQLRRYAKCYGDARGVSLDTLDEKAQMASNRWRLTDLSFGQTKVEEIATTALDESTYALSTMLEDETFGTSGTSGEITPSASDQVDRSAVPGQRARLLAAGTKNGNVFIWDIRGSVPGQAHVVNTLPPVRIIRTDSPQISCLAMTALYLVSGGTDGLVQAWEPLASTEQPVRTINSRFSTRVRRLNARVDVTGHGGGSSLSAAGAVCLDPDPTVLRGMVSIGPHLRYWSYSSSGADSFAGRSRRLRRGPRRGNHSNQSYTGQGRGNIAEYIENEKRELAREEADRRRETRRLAGRFGIGLLGDGANDDDVLAYALMLSEESLAHEEEKRRSGSDSPGSQSASLSSSDTITPEGSVISLASPTSLATIDDDDDELAEAVRRSLQESNFDTLDSFAPLPAAESSLSGAQRDIPIRYMKSKRSRSSSSSATGDVVTSTVSRRASRSQSVAEDDLDYAIQLSLAEERSRNEGTIIGAPEAKNSHAEFPTLASALGASTSPPRPEGNPDGAGKTKMKSTGKGKGKARSS